jgi:hypothetical protein
MMVTLKTAPSLGADNFLSRQELCAWAPHTNREDFCRAFPAPALAIVMGRPSAAMSETDKESSRKQTAMKLIVRPEWPVRQDERIVFLTKRAGNPFGNMISLGRSLNNDVVLPVETVSKFHGYFINKDGEWSFTDQHSANGTSLNGKPLEKGTRNVLHDGDRMGLGAHLEARFLLPATLFADSSMGGTVSRDN